MARLKKVAAAAAQSLLPGIEMATALSHGAQPVGGVPEWLWSDPYSLGFITGYIVGRATEYAVRNGLPPDKALRDENEHVEIQAVAWAEVAPKERYTEILRRVSALAKSNDPEFKRGSLAAMKICGYSCSGSKSYANDADILAAEQTADLLAQGGVYAPGRSSVCGELLNRLFYDHILTHHEKDQQKKVVDRFLDRYEYPGFDLPVKIRPKNKEVSARQFLERLLHNDADGYFFIRKDGLPALPYDVCAFLPLSIALGAEHYDACLSAKIAQLESIFSAKLGWLTGYLYSRIATPAIEEKIAEPVVYRDKFFKQVLYDKSAWLTPRQKSLLKTELKEWEKSHPAEVIDAATLEGMLDELPDDVSMVVTRVLQLLTNKSYVSPKPEVQAAAANILINDPALKSIISAAESE